MSQATHKPILGIIGGIGSGKSLVAGELAKHGGFLIVGDRLGHEALKEPGIQRKVIVRFGAEIVDEQGAIDRRKLGARVFADRVELRALESLVFPYIERRIREQIAQARQREEVAFIVLDAAVMLEAGWGRECDKLIFVEAPRAVRLERLARKHGWSEKEVSAREEMQMDLSAKLAQADFVVDNGKDEAAVANQVREVLQRLGLTAQSA
jgi:dephospho-CoA kinase